MKRLPLALLLLGLGTSLQSQVAPETPITTLQPERPEAAISAASRTSAAIAAAKPSPAPSPKLSAETAAKVSADRPKYQPAKPVAANRAELPDRRDIDKPRNTIPRLPREMVEPKRSAMATPLETSADVVQLPTYIVREDKVPDFKERDLLTRAGKLALALKRHPGLNIPFLGNGGIALGMLEEEFRLERIAEMKELNGLYSDDAGIPARDTRPLLMREASWIDTGGSHAASRER